MLHINGVNAVTTKEKVQQVIAELLATELRAVNVSSLSPAYGDTQKATVKLKEGLANRMIQARYIRIGWLSCRVQERASELILWVANVGNEPTFERKEIRSIIDVTFISVRAAGTIRDWHVMDAETMSDHKYICFCLIFLEKKGWAQCKVLVMPRPRWAAAGMQCQKSHN